VQSELLFITKNKGKKEDKKMKKKNVSEAGNWFR